MLTMFGMSLWNKLPQWDAVAFNTGPCAAKSRILICLITMQLSHSPSRTRSEAFVSYCILSAHNVLDINARRSIGPQREECSLKHLRCKKINKKYTWIGSSWCKRKKKGSRRKTATSFCRSGFCWGGWSMFAFVEVSGCMSPRLHPSFLPSFFFFLVVNITNTHTHTPMQPSASPIGELFFLSQKCRHWVVVRRENSVPRRDSAAIFLFKNE